jgi:hypothetical protein
MAHSLTKAAGKFVVGPCQQPHSKRAASEVGKSTGREQYAAKAVLDATIGVFDRVPVNAAKDAHIQDR